MRPQVNSATMTDLLTVNSVSRVSYRPRGCIKLNIFKFKYALHFYLIGLYILPPRSLIQKHIHTIIKGRWRLAVAFPDLEYLKNLVI